MLARSSGRTPRAPRPPRPRRGLAALAAATLTLLAACHDTPVAPTPVAPTGNVVLWWDAVLLQAVREVPIGPPATARAIAIVHTAMYDAWAAYDEVAVGTRLGGALRRPAAERTAENKNEAVSVAAYRALVDLFPTLRARFDGELRYLGYDPANASTDPRTAAGVGNTAAAAVLAFRHADGANQLGDLHPGAYSDYTGYTPVNTPDRIVDPNRWQPLRVSDGRGGSTTQQAVAPQWGNVTPFALTSGAQFRPASVPNLYPSTGYARQVDEILAYSAGLTDRQKVIAEYWADGPSSELPPGHWVLFGDYVSRRDHHALDDDVKMFFALGNALLDVSIAVWDCKRAFDYVRPVTAVHYLMRGRQVLAWAGPGRGTRLIEGETWQPYQPPTVVTPPFPEFSSGHSAFSAAGAEVLRSYTGSDAFGHAVTVRAGSSQVEPGLVPAQDVTLRWATFTDAADESGISRRYGGIHFAEADLQSRAMGRRIGAMAWAKARTYVEGTAP